MSNIIESTIKDRLKEEGLGLISELIKHIEAVGGLYTVGFTFNRETSHVVYNYLVNESSVVCETFYESWGKAKQLDHIYRIKHSNQ